MATYAYKCPSCKHTTTVSKSIREYDQTETCEKCESDMIRDYSSEGGVSASFKGPGFFSTDYDTSEGNGR